MLSMQQIIPQFLNVLSQIGVDMKDRPKDDVFKSDDRRGQLTTVYRLSGTENDAPRPYWYSKELCLLSFLAACEAVDAGNVISVLLVDNRDAVSLSLSAVIKKAIRTGFEIRYAAVSGNCSSYVEAAELSLSLSDKKGTILLSEDDYLWLPGSLSQMMNAFTEIDAADYITPYDHPVRYDPDFSGGADIAHWCSRIYCSNRSHFRAHESTCMTFMVRANVLAEDFNVHRAYAEVTKKCPNDRGLFRSLQHLGDSQIMSKKRRLLLGPMPSLATHVHLPYLAPVVDWEQYALKIKG